GARPELLLERGPGAPQFIRVQRARRVAVLDELDEVVVPLAQAEEPRAGALLPRHALHPFPRGCVLVEAVRRNDAAGREEASPRLVHRTHALRIAAIPIRVKEPGRRRSPPAGRAAAAGPRSPARRSGSRAKASRRAPRRSGGSAPARSPCRWVWSWRTGRSGSPSRTGPGLRPGPRLPRAHPRAPSRPARRRPSPARRPPRSARG